MNWNRKDSASVVCSIVGRPNSWRRQWFNERAWKSFQLATCCLLFSFIIFAANVGYAQTFYASVAGIVTDPQGAVVPGAAVSVVDTSTLAESKTVTNHDGSYSVSFLQPGNYVVRIEKMGFEKYSTSPFDLVLNQAATVDAVLRVGAETQSITVSAAGTALNDTNPQLGNQFGSDDLINLPQSIGNTGASVLVYATAVPGASGTSPDDSAPSPNEISLGGGRVDTNPIIIDGLPSNMGVNDTYGVVPTPDSTEELQVLTAPFSAQYGQTGGGALLTTTRSGTTNFHGSLFEWHSDQSMTALGYFTSPTAKVPVSVNNYFGGSIGGPVWIPGFFDGRNRHLFFFTDWEDTLRSKGETLNTDVPTAAELTGNFSGVTPTGAASPIIYNPATSVVVAGKRQETAFPGNIIPASSLDPVGMRIISYYPAPNCALSTGDNYCVYPSQLGSYLYNADRFDYNPTDYDHIWAKFSRDGPHSLAIDYIPNAANPSELGGWTDNDWTASWSHIFSPKITNELRGGYVSEVNYDYPDAVGVSSLGLTGVTLSQFPDISVSGLESLGTSAYEYNLDGHYILNDALVMQLGRHVLSLGGEFISYYYSQYEPGLLSGSYNFTGTFSSISGQSSLANAIADTELGLPATTTISTTNSWFRENARYSALYVQDDYRVSQKLTVNLGLRWEYDGPFAETKNQQYTFNPTEVDPTTGKLGAIEFAGYDGAPHVLTGRDYLGFLPRVGFSYHALKNTVVRGGYGIYQLPGIGLGATALFTSKSTVSASFISPNGGVTPNYELKNGVPAYSPEVGANGEPLIPTSLTDPTKNVAETQLNGSLAYNQQWEFGIQQDLGGGWLAEADYVGNHGVHLPIELAENQIPPTPGCCYGLSSAQSMRPYPQVLNVTYYTNGGAADYNALLAQLSHRWRGGISMVAAYTWAKEMDDVDASSGFSDAVSNQNTYNLHAQWGVAMIDIPQRLSITGVYAVPIGAGGKLFATTPVVNQIIGHWEVGALGDFQVGYPYNVSQSNITGLFNGAQYTTQVGNPNISRSSRTLAEWFNPKAFAITPQDTLGNTPRASLFGPGMNEWDISLMRVVPLRDHISFTFQAQAVNVVNHPQFDGLDTTITDSTFGKVTAAQDPRVIKVSGRIRF